MKQKPLICLMAFVLCVFSVSCRSMLKYEDNSSNIFNSSDAIISGYIVSETKRSKTTHNESDIVISGRLTQSFWSSFTYIIGTGLHCKWKGRLLFSGVEQPLLVVIWTNPPDKRFKGLSYVSIRGLPDSFNCKDFDVLSNRPPFSKPETYNRLAEFTLNGKIFRLEFFPQRRFQNIEDHYGMLQDKKQKIHIVDENKKIYADFDMNSYRIYEQPPTVSIEELQMVIAAFSVVQHICKE